MKYLDDRIIIHLDSQDAELPFVPEEGINKYMVYRYNVFQSAANYKELIFVGNLYHDGGTDEHIDITDIVRSLKEVPNSDSIRNNSNNWATTLILQDMYKVVWEVKYNGIVQTSIESDWLTVSMVYRYPNYTYNFNDGENTFFDTFDTEDGMRTVLQGLQTYRIPPSPLRRFKYLLPAHYPLRATDTYKFAQAFIAESGTTALTIDIKGTDTLHYYNNITFANSMYKKGTLYVTSINNLVGSANTISAITEDIDIYDDSNRLIGKLDSCYKRYYLMWQDRFGGFQSQAFNDYATYSEGFNVTEIQNYQNERSKATISIQPKWKINSGWIEEKLFPLYESIYVSPILYLYDSQEDKLYDVIVNGDYVEKTYRSEKKMLNINLELQMNTKQNIIY